MRNACREKMKRFLVFISVILADQISKLIVLRYYPTQIATNNGGAFSILQGRSYYTILVVLLLAVLVVFFLKLKKSAFSWPLVFVISGASANLIDRVFRGSVVDFINFKIWPSFNLADISLSIGIIWLLVLLLSSKQKV
jgi:signal peptidase II